MMSSHNGEVVMKEAFGSSSTEILYVKPADQHCVVAVRHARQGLLQFLKSVFLPNGYPDSVSEDYMAYQIWDTAQAFCSTITGTLATQEVLRSVGVGSAAATPMAATITWVLKDGCGHLSKILFAYSYGSSLDAYSKKWRLYADTLNDVAMCVEMALPAFPDIATPVLCLSTMMKAVVGVAGGATRAAMTRHHALRGNLGDVAAKDSAQETAVNLAASLAALLVIAAFGRALPLFALMVALHVVCNYMAVRSVCLRTFNDTRYLQVIDQYIREQTAATPVEINTREPILLAESGLHSLDAKFCGFKIVMGASARDQITKLPAQRADELCQLYRRRQYILLPDHGNRRMCVLIKQDAEVVDQLQAYYHAVMLSMVICAINNKPVCVLSKAPHCPLAEVCRVAAAAQWAREDSPHRSQRLRYRASCDLHRYVDLVAAYDWRRMVPLIENAGWDLSSSVLAVDEWRVVSQTLSATGEDDVPVPAGVPADSSEEIAIPKEASHLNFFIEPTFTVGAFEDSELVVHEVAANDAEKKDN